MLGSSVALFKQATLGLPVDTWAPGGHPAPSEVCYLFLTLFDMKILSPGAGDLLRSWGNFLSSIYVNIIRTVPTYMHDFREIVLCYHRLCF